MGEEHVRRLFCRDQLLQGLDVSIRGVVRERRIVDADDAGDVGGGEFLGDGIDA